MASLAPLPDTLCTTAGIQALNGIPSGGTYSGTGVTASQFDPAAAGVGIHALIYSYTDGNNCTDADTMVVVVEVCTGLEHALFAPVTLYPNPNRDTFSISGLPPGCEIEVWSAWGQKLFAHLADVSVLEVSLHDISKGTYMVKIGANGEYVLRKVVVR
jgi:trimeric autotransporter adhesin